MRVPLFVLESHPTLDFASGVNLPMGTEIIEWEKGEGYLSRCVLKGPPCVSPGYFI